ncbi:conserved hypothetical protein [Gammaproteobacteria bacterium]
MSLFDNFNQKTGGGSPSAVSGDQKAVFVDYIKLQVYEDGYIDRAEERKLLERSIELGIGIDEGLSIMRNLSQQQGYVIEREVENQAKEVLGRFAVSGGVIDKKEFNDAVGIFMSACKGKVSESDSRRRLKKIILESGWKVKEGGLFGSNWFTEIPQ